MYMLYVDGNISENGACGGGSVMNNTNRSHVERKADGAMVDRQIFKRLKGKFLDSCVVTIRLGDGNSERTATTRETGMGEQLD